MPTPQEFYVLVPARRAGIASETWGPFRAGFRRSESPRAVAEWFAKSKPGARVLGPFDPKKDPRRKRAMDETRGTPNTPEMIAHMLKELEHPAKMLEQREQDFIYSVSDQFDRKRSLSARQFEVLERIYAERTA